MIDDGVNLYTYNAANRMIQAITGTETIDYGYDGNGDRVAREANGAETHYFYNVAGSLLGEYDTSGGFDEYVYIQAKPAARIRDDTTLVGTP